MSDVSSAMLASAIDSPSGAGAQVRYRSLSAARDAYSASADESCRRELSREAHSLLSEGVDAPSSPQLKAAPTWSPFLLTSEAGHVEELANHGTSLLLRGVQHGLVGGLLCASLGDAAGWPTALTMKINAALLLCCAIYSGLHEALDTITYAAYHERERQREAWGALARFCPASLDTRRCSNQRRGPAALLDTHDIDPPRALVDAQRWTTSPKGRSRRWCNST